MKCTLISCVLVLGFGTTLPVLGDAIGDQQNAPGPMEYLEVEGSIDRDAEQRNRAELVQTMANRLLNAGKQEQIKSLLLRQKGQVGQLLQREERARAEAERLRLEREAARSNEQQEREEQEGAS